MRNRFGKRPHNNTKDQFYTNPNYALQCIQKVNDLYTLTTFDLCVEPSAGTGSFFNLLPKENSVGYDIDPKNKHIIHQNFFDVEYNEGNVLVIGNPPFGRISSLAIKFFNHAAKFAKVIAFIVPQTFNRISVQNKLDFNFRLVHNEDVTDNIFTPHMAAKCSFQIWERHYIPRKKIELPTTHKDWTFLSFGPLDTNNQPTPPKDASFAILAYGGNVGKIITSNLHTLRPKSWHWIKTETPDVLIERFKSLDYSISTKTVRQNSLGRAELVKIYSEKYGPSKQ